MDVVGVDGCKTGWFAVRLSGAGQFEATKFKTFQELVGYYADADLILVDIPIGLPEDAEPRKCDLEARKHLGPRASSVFPAPTRQAAIQAKRKPTDYDAACKEELRYAGKKLSKQAFAIAPKIAEVDAVVQETRRLGRPPIREIHPEVCFWALNGKRPMQHSKKEPQGKSERTALLQSHEPLTSRIIDKALRAFLRKDVAEDDIVDALAAAVTASHGHGGLQSLPYVPFLDAKDLPMEMVYWVPPRP